jgi:hypothetical protein
MDIDVGKPVKEKDLVRYATIKREIEGEPEQLLGVDLPWC